MKKILAWCGLLLIGGAAALAAPPGYVELACRPQGQPIPYATILPEADHRAEGLTLLTYPEWHIVHAYEDYARVIRDSDPHDFDYLSSIGGFWSSLCRLSRASGPHGGFPGAFKQTAYTIGVSFTVELLAKASYEETVGRVATWVRGPTRAPLDDLSAQQAQNYSVFLRQVPWYRWDFKTDAAALSGHGTDGFRDRERRLALGIEYRAKAAYAGLIALAMADMPPDPLRLRMIVQGLSAKDMANYEGVTVITERPQGIEIETPRYSALTDLMSHMAQDGGTFVEIAGNDDIMFTLTSDTPYLEDALYSFTRQGFGDTRHLILLPVGALANRLRGIDGQTQRLEHIHDY